MMLRYINADKLKQYGSWLKDASHTNISTTLGEAKDIFDIMIDSQECINYVEPQTTKKWVAVNTDGKTTYTCPVCDYYVDDINSVWNYCPVCGEKIELGRNNV